MSDDETPSYDTRQAATYLFGDDSPKNLRRLDWWAFSGGGPNYWKSSKSRSAKRYYPLDELRKFKLEMRRGARMSQDIRDHVGAITPDAPHTSVLIDGVPQRAWSVELANEPFRLRDDELLEQENVRQILWKQFGIFTGHVWEPEWRDFVKKRAGVRRCECGREIPPE